MLWYGYGTLNQRKELFERFNSELNENGITRQRKHIYNGEIILNIIQDNTMVINPGVLGCGILIANLSDASIKQLEMCGKNLELVYKNAVIDNHYDGTIRFCFKEIQ